MISSESSDQLGLLPTQYVIQHRTGSASGFVAHHPSGRQYLSPRLPDATRFDSQSEALTEICWIMQHREWPAGIFAVLEVSPAAGGTLSIVRATFA